MKDTDISDPRLHRYPSRLVLLRDVEINSLAIPIQSVPPLSYALPRPGVSHLEFWIVMFGARHRWRFEMRYGVCVVDLGEV